MLELRIFPDVTGGVVRDWYYASCELSDPPGWLSEAMTSRGHGIPCSNRT